MMKIPIRDTFQHYISRTHCTDPMLLFSTSGALGIRINASFISKKSEIMPIMFYCLERFIRNTTL